MSEPLPDLSIEDRASALSGRGWGPIPLPTRKKAQPPRGFTGGDSPLPSFADWFTYYQEDPDQWGNLGARMPQGVVGVDVDAYDEKNGAGTWALLNLDGDWPATVVLSARFQAGYDGVSGIRLYRLPDEVDQSTLWGAHDGIEILRFGHRYAVAPGSTHPNGHLYQAFDMRTRLFVDNLPPVADLPMLTVEQARLLTVDDAPWAGQVSATREPDPNPACVYTMKIVSRALHDLDHASSRYGTMSDAVWALISGEDEGHHLGTALDVVKLAYIGATAKDRREAGAEPPASEFDRNVRDARAKVDANPTDEMFKHCCSTGEAPKMTLPEDERVDEDDDLDEDWSTTPKADDEAPKMSAYDKAVRAKYAELRLLDDAKAKLAEFRAGEAPPLAGLSLTDFLAQPDEEIRYRVMDLWPAEGRVLLAAAAKTGKTTMVTANLVPSLVDGTPFLGRFEASQVEGTVVVFNMEVGPATLRRWMRDAGVVNTDKVVVVNLRGKAAALALASPEGRKRTAAFLRSVGAECALLDPLAPVLASLGLDENSNRDVALFFAWWSEVMMLAGIVDDMVVHHTGHAGERSRGASRLLDEPDAIWTLTKSADGEDDDGLGAMFGAPALRFLQAYGRDVEMPAEELEFDQATRLLTLTGVSKGKSKQRKQRESAIDVVRRKMSGGETFTIGQIKGWLTGRPEARQLQVDGLIEAGLLYPTGNISGGRWMLYGWSESP